MTKQQVVNLDRTSWKCDGCLGIMAGDAQTEEKTTPTFDTKATQFIDKLTILQWNADALLSKIEELRGYLEEKDIDIFMIQETKLISSDRDIEKKFPGFTVKRQDRPQKIGCERNRGGGVMVGIKKNIPFRIASLDFRTEEDEITESISIEIPRKNKQKLRINNLYIPPIRNTASEKQRQRSHIVKTDKWPCQNYDIVLGDINALSPIWDLNCEESNKRGETIEEWIAETSMIPINNGLPTRTDRTSGKGSAPDLTMIHSSLLSKCHWDVESNLGADHMPIILRFEEENSIPSVESKPRYKWRTKDINWEAYTNEVERNIKNYNGYRAKKVEKKLQKTIKQAAKKHVRKKEIDNKTKAHLTPEIKDAIKEINKLRKTVLTNRKEWIDACRNVTNMVRENKKTQWKEYVGTLDMSTNPQQVWRTIHSLDGKYPAKSENEVLTVNGVALVDDTAKANAFGKTYRQFSKLPTRKSDRKFRRHIRKRLKRKTTTQQESEQDITMEELNRVIEEAGNNKAAGTDDIPYELIKHLGPKARQMLLYIFNQCWAGEELPSNWLTALIKPLLKDGKDPKETKSYRPISLTSCLGKLLEKIIADRLTFILEDRGLLADSQAGFRQNRCTVDQVLKMTQDATDQMHRKGTESSTIVTFFDYEKAYDKVWRLGLIHKMQTMGIPDRFIKYTRNFLMSRKTAVEVNGSRSKSFILKEGLPQGSAISPILFLIFINDIGVDLHPLTIASLFADDTSIWIHGNKDRKDTQTLLQTEVNVIMDWAELWKMSVNKDKTQSLVISSSTKDTSWKPEIKAGTYDVKTVEFYKFLGIDIDQGLRFNQHVKRIVEKTRKRVNILKSMAWKDWGNSLEIQRTLYIQFIRSCLEYASSSWSPWLSNTNLQKLERVQNEALRSITRTTKTCPVDFLRLEANLEPLKDRYVKNDEILMDKYKRLPTSDSRKRMVENHVPPRLKTRHGWRSITTCQHDDIYRDTTTPPTPPWRSSANFKVDYVNLEKGKANYTSQELKTVSQEKIESYQVDYTIYTDGSTNDRQENGGAGYYAEDANGQAVANRSFPAGLMCSSYTGECVALLEALEWITITAISEHRPIKVLICSDSKSMAMSLQKNHWKDDDPWLKRIKEKIHQMQSEMTLLWIPSHCDINGNEIADELAKDGTTMDQSRTIVTHKIVKAKIKNRKWKTSHSRASATYKERRLPKYDIEKEWPLEVRMTYTRIRTGHAMELKRYRHFIGITEDNLCDEGCGVEESVEHVLCNCAATAESRARQGQNEVTIDMMVTHPNVCRKILMTRFGQLRLPSEKRQTPACRTSAAVG